MIVPDNLLIDIFKFGFEVEVVEEEFDLNYFERFDSQLQGKLPTLSKLKSDSSKLTDKDKKKPKNPKKQQKKVKQIELTASNKELSKQLNIKPEQLKKIISKTLSNQGPNKNTKVQVNVPTKGASQNMQSNTSVAAKVNSKDLANAQVKGQYLSSTADKEVKQSKKDQDNAKGVENFLKQVKEKNKISSDMKEDVSIRKLFTNKYKFLLATDITNRLKLRESAILTTDIIEDLFSIILTVLSSDAQEALINTNIKESLLLIDNLLDMAFSNDKSIFIFILNRCSKHLKWLIESQAANSVLNSFLINFSYIFTTYLKDFNEISIESSQIIGLTEDFKFMVAFTASTIKEILEANVTPQSFNLSQFEELTVQVYSHFNYLQLLGLADSSSNQLIETEGIYLELLKKLKHTTIETSKIMQQKSKGKEFNSFQTLKFNSEISNFNFLTRLNSILEMIKGKVFSLNMKTTKYVENSLKSYQDSILKSEVVQRLLLELSHSILFGFFNNYGFLLSTSETAQDQVVSVINFVLANVSVQIFLDVKEPEFLINQSTDLVSDSFVSVNEEFALRLSQTMVSYTRLFENAICFIQSSNLEKQTVLNFANRFSSYVFRLLSLLCELRNSASKEKFVKLLQLKFNPLLHQATDSEIESMQVFKNCFNSSAVKLIRDKVQEVIAVSQKIQSKVQPSLNANHEIVRDDSRHSLLNSLRCFKELKQFFVKYDTVKFGLFETLSIYSDSFSTLTLEDSIKVLLYITLINPNNAEDIHKVVNANFIKKLLYFDSDNVSSALLFYVTDELNHLSLLIERLVEGMTREKDLNSFIINTLGELKDFDHYLIDKSIQVYSQLVSQNKLGYREIKEDLLAAQGFNHMLANSSSKPVVFNNNHIKIVFSLFLYDQLLTTAFSVEPLPEELHHSLIMITSLMLESYAAYQNKKKEFNLISDIKKVNDKIVSVNSLFPNYAISSADEATHFIISLFNFQLFYASNPDYFNTDDIEVSSEVVNEAELLNEKKISSDKKDLINLDLLMHSCQSVITWFKSAIAAQTILSHEAVLYVCLQRLIIKILSIESIFRNFVSNPKLLESTVSSFIETSDLNSSLETIKKNSTTTIQSIVTRVTDSITNNSILLLKLPKIQNKLIFLFKEKALFSLFLSKDLQFVSILNNKLESTYKTTILEQESLDHNLKLLQDESSDIDYLEPVVHSIFSKEILEFLKFPTEMFNYLQHSQDQFKYDIKSERKEFYNCLYSYYYTWKTIMAKIENGFKLYTTNKSFVETVDKHKTLLKFIVDYLQKNSHLYEIFLLQTVSFLQLLESKYSEQDSTTFDIHDAPSVIEAMENFNEKDLKFEFNEQIYVFVLSVLYKFLKIFPSLVRFWYDMLKGKLKTTFRQIIFRILLPQLTKELRSTFNNNRKVLTDKGFKLYDEVQNNYFELDLSLNDEIKFSVQIKISPSFPLKKLDVEFKSNAHISSDKCLNIKMNLNQAMNLSMDNICDNLIMWADNCKQFIILNTEPCPVCYYYLHNTDKSLPTLVCRQCKKIFHSLCMKEWFKTSQQNSGKTNCPMCRSEWVYKGNKNY